MNVSDTMFRRLSSVALASMVAGCAGSIPAGGTDSQEAGPAMQVSGKTQSGWLAPEARAKNAHLIYAAGYDASEGAVFVYQGKKPYKKVGELPSGSNWPGACYVDGKGNVYVANDDDGPSNNGFIREYAKGKSKPTFEYTTSLSFPKSIAVGADGTLYVADLANNGEVVEFPQKSNTPALIIPNSVFAPLLPGAVALDSANNLYVGASTFGSSPQYNVWKFAPNTAKGTALNLTDLDDPSTIIVDKNNNLVVGNGDGGLVSVYPAGQVNPSVQFSVPFGTTQIAFDKAENIFYWVGSAFGVHAYSYKTGKAVQEFDGPCPSGGSYFCMGVAAGPAARL
jgi:hypothetical protein